MTTTSYIEEDRVRKELKFWDFLKKLWPYLYEHKRVTYFVIIVAITYAALGRALPILFGYAIDEGINKNNLNVIHVVAAIYLGLEVLRLSLYFVQSYVMEKLGNRILYQIRERLIRHVQRLPINFFDKNPAGRIVTRLTNDVLSLGELFNQGFTSIFIGFLQLIAIVGAMIYISFTLTALTLLTLPLALYLCIKLSKKLRYYFGEAKKRMASINAFTAESLNGMKVIELFSQRQTRENQFSKLSSDYRTHQLNTVKYFALLWPVIGFFNVFTAASALFFGAWLLTDLDMSIGQLSAYLLLVQSLYMPLRIILERYNQFQNSLTGADRIFQILSEVPETDINTESLTGKLKGAVEFKNLNFRYVPGAELALKNINLSISPGQTLAFVGRTGSGKTTLINLLQKFYLYTDGDILVDGVSLKKISLKEIRHKIAIVQQDPFVFRGTIASNITLGSKNYSEPEIKAALEMAGGQKILRERPEGIHHFIEEKGGNLSTGEKQLISFARALLFNPDILVLDEATANIDSQSEELIQKATATLTRGRTSIIIAHRLSTIVNADRIVVLSHGEIIEVGTHAELMNINGHYSKMYHNQVFN